MARRSLRDVLRSALRRAVDAGKAAAPTDPGLAAAPTPPERRVVPAPWEGDLREAITARTLRLPAFDGASGDGAGAARQLDVALTSAGFKASGALLWHVAGLEPAAARDAATTVVAAARRLVGGDVEHNTYFIDFPAGVPDTLEFWTACIAGALLDPAAAETVQAQLAEGRVDLLDLPAYGRYQHTFEAMVAVQDELIAGARTRTTVLDLGDGLDRASHALYLDMAGAGTPPSADDLSLLAALAERHVGDAQPEVIDMRESRAVVNAARLRHDVPVEVDTVTDVLRLAAVLSGGDVTLETPTRFAGIRRPQRRALLRALDVVVADAPAKLGDVRRHREAFKRLGERLHPHEHPQLPGAQRVFAVARGDQEARSTAGTVDLALRTGRPDAALRELRRTPGMLLRSVDRLLREGADPDAVVEAVTLAAPDTSSRVLLSLREHVMNREAAVPARAFVNRRGRLWHAPDERPPLAPETVERLAEVLDAETARRLPRVERVAVDPAVRGVALPLTAKQRPDGFGLLPRGSVQAVGPHVRFFTAWRERAQRTDHDLAVLLLDEALSPAGQVSWTNLAEEGMTHSGDLTEARDGATEFIDADLERSGAAFVVPEVLVFSGEGFDAAAEAYFGFMDRRPKDRGLPFEAATVIAKSDLLGSGRVALPVVFHRDGAGGWQALWLHLNLAGFPGLNRVEGHASGTALVIRGMIERRYLRVDHLEALLRRNGTTVEPAEAAMDGPPPDVLIAMTRPEGVPAGTLVHVPATLGELLSSG